MADKAARYDEEFKKSLVALHNNGKSQSCLMQGIRYFSIGPWLNGLNSIPRLRLKMAKFLPPEQIKDLQKRNCPA
jgi:transposase